jgi:hypothetical protein
VDEQQAAFTRWAGERVADLEGRDLTATAWADGVRRRRHRRLVITAAAAAGTAVVVGITALPRSGDEPAPAPAPVIERGERVWDGPTLAEEADLPVVASVLPDRIDLGGAPAALADAPVASAYAAYAVVVERERLDRVVLVTPEGDRSVDVSRLDRVTQPDGYRRAPVDASMLSADGRTPAFPQDDGTAVLDLATATWSTRPGLVDPSRWLVSPDGARRARFSSYGEAFDDAEAIRVEGPEGTDLLKMDPDGRSKECCPVAGWLDDHTLAFETRSGVPGLFAWDLGTARVRRIARIEGVAVDVGERYVGSYAGLG